MATVLSVNGQDGATLRRSSGIRLVQEDSQALVLRSQQSATKHGQPGHNAPESIRGGPAGTLAVQLSESNLSQGAIRVQRIDYRATSHLPESTEVPVGRDLRLTAIGGAGEDGHDGGDGQRGLDGDNGTGASEADDATDGTDGGRGGDAGRGSSGADGGPGGAIDIIVNEHNTHLLMAISCDVRGGKGGTPGKHGDPGAGGKRGKGGQGWRWDKIIGYRPVCTPSCIKNTANGEGSSHALVVRTGTHLSAATNALMAQTGSLMVRGNNVQAVIAQAAMRYKAMRQPSTDSGFCRCGGGTGSCQGCDVKPIRATLTRAPGLDGRNGERGRAVTTLLVAGSQGVEGMVTIGVCLQNGTTQRYSAPWSLELVDFEVEDENEDGVFEPGEHVFIRRITVRNVGGMPSPTCEIPLTLADTSEWFESVPANEGGLTYLPTSIPSGESASTTGSIKVRIKQADTRMPAHGVRFSANDTLRIRADMPWLDRRLPSFDFAKEIEISYPCGLSSFQYLSTVAQGAISKVNYKIHNFSNRPLGVSGVTGFERTLQVRTSIPREFGQVSAEDDRDHQNVTRRIPRIRPRDSFRMQQQYHILSNARSHKHFAIKFELWLESPRQEPNSDMLEEVLVEWHTIRPQVSNTYTRGEDAKLLLITNPKTTERQSLAIQNFVRNDLRLEMDLCNVHQNGGLLSPQQDDFDDPLPLISAYQDKTILILDNSFEFFDAGERTTSQLCEPQWISDLAMSGTSALFMGCGAGNSFETLAYSSVLAPTLNLDESIRQVQRSHIFKAKEQLVDSVIQEKQFGSARVGVSAIPLRPWKWYRFGRNKAAKQAEKLATYLRSRLPNERFMVSYVARRQRSPPHRGSAANEGTRDEQTNAAHGYLVIFTGLDHHRSIVSTEYGINVSPGSNRLDALGKYTIIASLPYHQRADLLWKRTCRDGFIVKALALSVMRDVAQQISGFTASAHGPLLDVKSTDSKSMEILLRTHIPSLSTLFNNPQAKLPIPAPESIQEVVQWTLAFTARYRRLDRLTRAMISQRPSTRHLEDYTPPSSLNSTSILEKISQLTKQPENIFKRGQLSASDVVPQTRSCAPQEWNNMVQYTEQWRERMETDMEGAQEQLRKMLVEVQTTDSGVGWMRELRTPDVVELGGSLHL